MICSGPVLHTTICTTTSDSAAKLGINDYHKLVDQIARVLRPGGMLLIEETDLVICDEHLSLMDAEQIDAPNHSWHASFMRCVKLAIQKKGGDRPSASLLKTWLGANSSLTTPGHEDCYTPIGSWYADPRQPS